MHTNAHTDTPTHSWKITAAKQHGFRQRFLTMETILSQINLTQRNELTPSQATILKPVHDQAQLNPTMQSASFTCHCLTVLGCLQAKKDPPSKTIPLRWSTCTKELGMSLSDNNSPSHVCQKQTLLIIKRMTTPQLIRTMCILPQTKMKAFKPESSSRKNTCSCNTTDMIRLYRPHSKPIHGRPTLLKMCRRSNNCICSACTSLHFYADLSHMMPWLLAHR